MEKVVEAPKRDPEPVTEPTTEKSLKSLSPTKKKESSMKVKVIEEVDEPKSGYVSEEKIELKIEEPPPKAPKINIKDVIPDISPTQIVTQSSGE